MKILKGHSPNSYSRDALAFGELLDQCPHIRFVCSGSYHHKGSSRIKVTFSPGKVRNMLIGTFRDGEGTYRWHATIRGASLATCAQEAEQLIRKWNPNIEIIHRGFPRNKKENTVGQKNSEAQKHASFVSRPDSNGVVSAKDYSPVTGNGCVLTSSVSMKNASMKNALDNIEEVSHENSVSPISYQWIHQDDIRVYRALEEATLEEDHRTVLHNEYAKIRALYAIVGERTSMTNAAIAECTRRLTAGKVLIPIKEKSNRPISWHLMFVDNIPNLPTPSIPQPSDGKEVKSMSQETSNQEVAPARLTPLFQHKMAIAALQAVDDEYNDLQRAHEEIRDRVHAYNQNIAWILGTFGDLTFEEKKHLEAREL